MVQNLILAKPWVQVHVVQLDSQSTEFVLREPVLGPELYPQMLDLFGRVLDPFPQVLVLGPELYPQMPDPFPTDAAALAFIALAFEAAFFAAIIAFMVIYILHIFYLGINL